MNLKSRPFYFRSEVQCYVLFLIGRVGSTYLMQLLNYHSNIKALGEELHDLQEKGATAQLEWVRRYFTPQIIGRYKVVGFNTKMDQVMDLDAFANMMRKFNCNVIHLQRCNRIKGTVSYFVGKKLSESTGMWGLFDEGNRPPAVYIDPAAFDEHLQIREKLQQDLDQYIDYLKLPTLSLSYEDLLLNKEAVLQQIFTFLQVKPLPVKAQALKITNDDLHKAIINFDELKGRYIGTHYEKMFDEVLVACQ
jgi:LPS sulfotransferase NodH